MILSPDLTRDCVKNTPKVTFQYRSFLRFARQPGPRVRGGRDFTLQPFAPARLCKDRVREEWQSLSDEEAVARVRAGETMLFELLMRRYNQRLFRAIRSVLAADADAEDVLQEAWVRAFEHLGQFAGRAAFPTWVTKIALYEAFGRARKNRRFTALENEDGEIMAEAQQGVAKPEDPEQQALRGELGQALQWAVERLPEAYRTVFVLRAVEQLSTTETAQCLSLSEEAVKTRLHRSRALLRRDLEARMGPALTETYAFLGYRCDRVVGAVLARIVNLTPQLRASGAALPS
jgi:RNA polymerase sigma-70 factor (ECF subfamily)